LFKDFEFCNYADPVWTSMLMSCTYLFVGAIISIALHKNE